jgi:F0F1-type ATP synthase assembly protein I
MTQRRAPSHPPQPAEAGSNDPRKPASVDPSVYTTLLVSMVLSMSWQLAIIVIVPIVGGYLLDQKLASSPIFVFVGLAIAILGMVGLLRRTVQVANAKVATLQKDKR